MNFFRISLIRLGCKLICSELNGLRLIVLQRFNGRRNCAGRLVMLLAFAAQPGSARINRRCRTRNCGIINRPRIAKCTLDGARSNVTAPANLLASSTKEIADELMASSSMHESDRKLFEMLTPSRAALFAKVLGNRSRHITFVMDGVYGAHNLAAIARSCDAWGIQDLHFVAQLPQYVPERAKGLSETEGRPASILHSFRSDQSVRNVSKNCHKWLSIQEYTSAQSCIEKLRERGYKIIVSSLSAKAPAIHDVDLSDKCAFVFGNERHGVTKEMEAEADGFFTIPMMGFVESMNVSVAVGTTASLTVARCRAAMGTSAYLLSLAERQQLAHEWLTDRATSRGAPKKWYSRRDVTKLGSRCEERIVKEGMFTSKIDEHLLDGDYWRRALRLTAEGGARVTRDVLKRKAGFLGENTFEKKRNALKLCLSGSHALSCEAALAYPGKSRISRQCLSKFFDLVCDRVSDLYEPHFDQYGVPALPIYAEESHAVFSELESSALVASAEICVRLASKMLGMGAEQTASLVAEATEIEIARCMAESLRLNEARARELENVCSSEHSSVPDIVALVRQRYPQRRLIPRSHRQVQSRRLLDEDSRNLLQIIVRLWNVAYLSSELYQALWDRQMKGKNLGRIHSLRFALLESVACESYAEMILLGSSPPTALLRTVFEWDQVLGGLQESFAHYMSMPSSSPGLTEI